MYEIWKLRKLLAKWRIEAKDVSESDSSFTSRDSDKNQLKQQKTGLKLPTNEETLDSERQELNLATLNLNKFSGLTPANDLLEIRESDEEDSQDGEKSKKNNQNIPIPLVSKADSFRESEAFTSRPLRQSQATE